MATNRVKLEDVINEAKTTLESGDPDRAVALCNHVFKYYPRCLEASRVLGEAYTEKRLLDEADQLFVFVLSADPQDVLGYVDRGFIAYERGQAEEAIMYYERALELDPSIKQLREELLRLYHEQPAPGRNRIRLTKAGLANGRLRDGFYGQAIEEYNAVLRETPQRLDVQIGLMEAYWRNRDYPRAEQIAHSLLEAHPDLVKANLLLWHIYGVRRNQDRAAPYLEKAHALDPLNLLAERLFEDAVVSNDAMRYISMLGIAAIPAPEVSGSASDQSLVPDWASTNRHATDAQLGLRSDVPSPLAETPSNLGLDLFALLADTEKHVADQQQEAEQAERAEALTGLDELRAEAAENDGGFDLFGDVEPPKVDFNAPKEKTNPGAAFDLDFGMPSDDELSMFEEIDPAIPAPGTPVVEPLSFDTDTFGSTEDGSASEVAPFDLFAAAEPAHDFAPAMPVTSSPEPAFDLFGDDDLFGAEALPVTPFNADPVEAFNLEAIHQEALPPEVPGLIQPFEPALEPVPLLDPLSDAHEEPAHEPAEEVVPVTADADEDAAQSKTAETTELAEEASAADEEPSLPLPVLAQPLTPEDDDSYLQFLLEDSQPPTVADHEEFVSASLPSLLPNPVELTGSALHLTPQAFFTRDEQGLTPDFVLEPTGSAQLKSQDSADSLDLLEPAEAQPRDFDETGQFNLAVQPQQNQEQENDAMPIKRGPQDENDVFDWEREELPDYLQAFAMDDDEAARAGLTSANPVIADVNTPPARIRPRDDTGAPGDLPDWLNPASNANNGLKTPSFDVRGEQIDLGGISRPGSGSLPNWLDATDLDAAGPVSKQSNFTNPPPAPSGFGGIEPFNLGDDSVFGGPTPTPAPPVSGRNNAPTPFAEPPITTPPDFGGMDDLAPFSFDDNTGGFDAIPPQSAPSNRSPFGGTSAFEPPPPPPARRAAPEPTPFSFGDDLGGMDDLIPFSLDEGAGLPLSTPPAEPPVRQTTPPPASNSRSYTPPMPKPSFMPSDDDMGDLTPFSLDDGAPASLPPVSRSSTPPPATPAPRSSTPYNPFEPGADTSGFEALDIGAGISPFSLDQGAGNSGVSSNNNRTPSPFGNIQPSPFGPIGDGDGGDFDIAPFSLGEDLPIFDDNPRSRGTQRLGLDAMNPLDTLDAQPFRSERRPTRHEPEIEMAPGEERPMIGRNLVDRIKQPGSNQAEEPTQTLFDRLKQRRQQQDEERARQPMAQPASQSVEPEPFEVVPFDEVERRSAQPHTAPFTNPVEPVTAQPVITSPVNRDAQTEAFDLTDLGLDQDLDVEAFNLSLEETMPTASHLELDAAVPAFTQEEPSVDSFDFAPFDLGDITEEEGGGAEPVTPVTTILEPVTPATFDLGEPTAPATFDFDEPALPVFTNDVEPFSPMPAFDTFDFEAAQPVQDDNERNGFQSPVTIAPVSAEPDPIPSFDFDQHDAAEPIFSIPDEPITPLVLQTPVVVQSDQPQSSVLQTTVQPVTPPTASANTANMNGNTQSVSPNGNGTAEVSELQLADQYFEQHDYSQSISHFNSAIKSADAEGLKTIVTRLKQIAGTADVSPRYHRVLGDAYKKQGLYQAALAEYSKALGPAVGSRK